MTKTNSLLLLVLSFFYYDLNGQIFLYPDEGNLTSPIANYSNSGGYVIASLESCYTPGSTTIEGCIYAVNIIKTNDLGDTIWTNKSSYFYTVLDPDLRVFENTDGSVTAFTRVSDNSTCNGQWSNTFPPTSWSKIEVMNFNSDGSILNRYSFEDDCSLRYSSIKKLEDDNYVILARYSENGTSSDYYESRLFIMNKNGEVLLSYSRPYDSVFGRGEILLNDQNEINVLNINQDDELILEKFDEDLNYLSTHLGETPIDVCEGLPNSAQKFHYEQYQNGDIVIGCREYVEYGDLTVTHTFTRISSDLDLIQQQSYELGRSTNFIEMGSDETVICSNFRVNNTFREIRITKFDQSLDSIASTSVIMDDRIEARSLLRTSDERLAIVGQYDCCNNLESPSQVFLLLENDLTDVKEVSQNKAVLKLFPNPTSGMMNVNVTDKESITNYSIINLVGETIMAGQFSANNEYIDITRFENGMYILIVFNEEGLRVGVEKIIKQ